MSPPPSFDHFWPPFRPPPSGDKNSGLAPVVRGDGIWVETADGRRYLDMFSGLCVTNVGHGRRSIVEAVAAQMAAVAFPPLETVGEATLALADKLASLVPDKGSRVFFVSGGSEAAETAIKLARAYHRARGQAGRYKIIGRRGSFHGASLASLALGGAPAFTPWEFGPYPPGLLQGPQPEPGRCAYCRGGSECQLECATEIERIIVHEGPDTVAAVIGEPISGSAGVHVPHADYWPTLRKICDRHGVLLIADEVVTGFGRTGKMLAMEHWSVAPDLTLLAKGLTSGYVPAGAVVASSQVATAFLKPSTALRHQFTYGGNPVAAAAALANIALLQEEKLVERSAEMGRRLLAGLQGLKRHDIVADARGLGLFCALEFSSQWLRLDDKERAGQLKGMMGAAFKQCGLLGRFGPVTTVAPPLCISAAEVDELLERLDRAVAALAAAPR